MENLQEMEVKTQQSRTAVNSGAKAGDPMPPMDPTQLLVLMGRSWGPTPENYKPDDDSAKFEDSWWHLEASIRCC